MALFGFGGLAFSIAALPFGFPGDVVRSASEVFSSPTADQLKKELAQIAQKEVSKEDTAQIITVEEILAKKISSLDDVLDLAAKTDQLVYTKLKKQQDSMQSALADVQRLRMAISGNRI